MMARFEFCATGCTRVGAIFCVDPADADLGFDVPVTSDRPGVAIRDTGTCPPPFIAAVFELTEIGAQEFEIHVEVAEIILAAERMDADEVTGGRTSSEPRAERASDAICGL